MSTPYCRHIKTNGRRCCAFAVRDEQLCYFHRASNKRHRGLRAMPHLDNPETVIHPLALDRERMQREPMLAQYFGVPTGPLLLDFPQIEDRESIQLALSMLLTALGQDRIDPKRATVMLYNLQVASTNAAKLSRESEHMVRETTLDESGNELAPDTDPSEIAEREELLAAIDEELAEEKRQRIEDGYDEDDEEEYED
jgi:hypothetical protein